MKPKSKGIFFTVTEREKKTIQKNAAACGINTYCLFIVSFAGADFGLLLLFYGFTLSGSFPSLIWEHFSGELFYLYTLPRIGGIVFVIPLCGDFDITDKTVAARDPPDVKLPAGKTVGSPEQLRFYPIGFPIIGLVFSSAINLWIEVASIIVT